MKKIPYNKSQFKKLFPVTHNAALAKRYKVAQSTIRLWAHQMGLRKKNWAWSQGEEKFLLKNRNKMAIKQIASAIGRTAGSVKQKRHRLILK